MAYRGSCANCGMSRGSSALKRTVKQAPSGRAIPPYVQQPLPHQTAENNRICTPCYTNFYREHKRAQQQRSSQETALDTLAAAASSSPIPSDVAHEQPLQASPIIPSLSPAVPYVSSGSTMSGVIYTVHHQDLEL